MRIDRDYALLIASVASASLMGLLLAVGSAPAGAEGAMIIQLAVFVACAAATRRPTLKAFHGIGVGEVGLGYLGYKVAPESIGSLRFSFSFSQTPPASPLSIAITAAYVVMACCQVMLIVKSDEKP